MQKSTVKEFGSSYLLLNPAQKKAVDCIEGPVMVIAGPGTGKTTLLTLRIANIIKKTDTDPSSILTLTFTESGAFAVRKKLAEIIGAEAYKVNIHTFHGFAVSVIEKYPDYFPRIIGSAVVSDAEQLGIIEKIVHTDSVKLLRPFGDPLYYIKNILREIHILKRENILPTYFKKSVEQNRKDIPEPSKENDVTKADVEKLEKQVAKNLELAFVYAEYEKELTKRKLYDYDDMLLEVIRAMEESGEFKLILQENYQYILADEHQDANASQNRILELLSDFHDSPNLFIVGDEKQAIYRFQGASLENFLYFSDKYSDALVIDLTHNYRSHQKILDAAHSLINKNPNIPGRERTRLISPRPGEEKIYIREAKTTDDELHFIAHKIKNLIEVESVKPEEIAVLYRDNHHAKEISDTLSAHGVPHRVESDHDILGEKDVLTIITLLNAIHDPSDSTKLAKALLLGEIGCDPASVMEVFSKANRSHKPLHECIKELDSTSDVFVSYKRITKWSKEAQTISFADFLSKIVQETNIVTSILCSDESLSRLGTLEAFFEKIKKVARSKKAFFLDDFIAYMEIVKDHGILTRRTYAEHEGGVRLMTAHRSKGLEFDHVFIVHARDGIWGNKKTRELFHIPVVEHARDVGRIEDERRLFYVAVTRARESVNISYAVREDDKEFMPSQFISEIDSDLVDFDVLDAIDKEELYKKKFSAPKIKKGSILDKELISSKFLSQPLSVTHVNNFLSCPWRYFFMNLIRVPQMESKHQLYGTVVHETLRSFFESLKGEKDMTKKQLIDLFVHNAEMKPFSVLDRKEAIEKGIEALNGYFDTYNGLWNRNLITEYSVKGVSADIGEHKLELTGKLDKVEMINETDVAVIDYKTGKPKSRNFLEGGTKDADGNYKRQLVFYKLLLDETGKFNMKYGELDFIEPNDSGKYKKEKFEIEQEEIVTLKETIKSMAKEITSLSFVGKNCDEKDCEYCSLGKILN